MSRTWVAIPTLLTFAIAASNGACLANCSIGKCDHSVPTNPSTVTPSASSTLTPLDGSFDVFTSTFGDIDTDLHAGDPASSDCDPDPSHSSHKSDRCQHVVGVRGTNVEISAPGEISVAVLGT